MHSGYCNYIHTFHDNNLHSTATVMYQYLYCIMQILSLSKWAKKTWSILVPLTIISDVHALQYYILLSNIIFLELIPSSPLTLIKVIISSPQSCTCIIYIIFLTIMIKIIANILSKDCSGKSREVYLALYNSIVQYTVFTCSLTLEIEAIICYCWFRDMLYLVLDNTMLV